jgi:uncharacterized membrane protein
MPWFNQERRILIVIVCAHFALLLTMGLFRHFGNMNSLNDLGFFDQAVWGTLHGQWFLDTNNIYGRPINWLSCHFNLFLLLFVPLYAIWPAAEWFTIAQALALSVAAWPIFLLASRVHDSERTGLLWAVIYLLNPFLLSAAAWDFHPVTIAVPLIAGALLAVEKKDFRLLVFCCLGQLLIQEQFGLTVAGFGALWGLKHRDWKWGFGLAGVGVLHAVLVIGLIMPALSPSGAHAMIDPSAGDSRYGWMGSSFSEILINILFHPIGILKTVIELGGGSYLISLALPFLGLFFAAPAWLLPASADLAANILSANSMPRGIIAYHSVTLVPILTVSTIYGTQRITLLLTNTIKMPLTKVILFITLALSYILAPLPLPGALNFWRPVQWLQLPDPTMKQVSALINERPSVSVQANVGAHFSQHQQIYRYPYKVGEADTIVLWLDSPTSKFFPHSKKSIGTVAHHLQMNPAEYLTSIDCLLHDLDYGVALWEEPWLVLSRGPAFVNADKSISNRLKMLRHSWQINSEEYESALQECRNKRP